MPDVPMWRPVRGGNAFEITVARLAQAIRLGLVAVGDRLPPERELAERLQVSRVTLREAIGALREAGYLESRRGRAGGTFVVSVGPGRPSGAGSSASSASTAAAGAADRAGTGSRARTAAGAADRAGTGSRARTAAGAAGRGGTGSRAGMVTGPGGRAGTGSRARAAGAGRQAVAAVGGRAAGADSEAEATEVAREMGDALHDALDYRRVLEGGAATLAASRPLSAADRQQLVARLAEASAGAVDGGADGHHNRRVADSRLHLAIAAASGSPSVAAAIADVQLTLDRLLAAIPVLRRNLAHSDRQHARIVEAILAGDATGARAAMEEHCDGTAELLRGLLG